MLKVIWQMLPIVTMEAGYPWVYFSVSRFSVFCVVQKLCHFPTKSVDQSISLLFSVSVFAGFYLEPWGFKTVWMPESSVWLSQSHTRCSSFPVVTFVFKFHWVLKWKSSELCFVTFNGKVFNMLRFSLLVWLKKNVCSIMWNWKKTLESDFFDCKIPICCWLSISDAHIMIQQLFLTLCFVPTNPLYFCFCCLFFSPSQRL